MPLHFFAIVVRKRFSQSVMHASTFGGSKSQGNARDFQAIGATTEGIGHPFCSAQINDRADGKQQEATTFRDYQLYQVHMARVSPQKGSVIYLHGFVKS